MENKQTNVTILEQIQTVAEAMKNAEAKEYIAKAIEIRDKFSTDKKNNYRIKDIPQEPGAAFNKMVEFSGTISFLILKIQHIFRNGKWRLEDINREINEIELFIKNAETIHAFKALSFDEEMHEQNAPPEYEYLRIKNGYYVEQRVNKIEMIHNLGYTYGRCFLYLPFLKEKLQQLQPKEVTSELTNKEDEPITLRTVCKAEHYQELIQQLHDRSFIDKDASTWLVKDRGMKRLINALLTVLENRGYILAGIIAPDDRCTLVLNTFKITISKETTKRQPTQKYLDEFEFIKNIGRPL